MGEDPANHGRIVDEARFGDWLLSGEIVYYDQPNISGPIVRVSLIAERR
jgi:hypothetical protein